MRKLLEFLYERRELAIFIAFEFLSIWLIINYNQRYNATFLNSSNALAAEIDQVSNNISDYFKLVTINERVMAENAMLQVQIRSMKERADTFEDSINHYEILGAKVINNSFLRSTNFITIAAGTKESIVPGMGVISSNGIVGQVKSVSRNYATIYSLLHPNILVSSKIKRTGTKCTVQWDQKDYLTSEIKFIPRHIRVNIGDTIVSSGYNSVFPEGLFIGYIEEFNLEDHMTFYYAKLKLSTDFTSLSYVYVIKNELKHEKDSIEQL